MNFRYQKYIKLLLLLFGVGIGTRAGVVTNDNTLTLQNVNVVDVIAGAVKPQMAIIIKDGKIAKIGNSATLKPVGKVMDLKGAYIIPGLIDVHAHVTAMYKPNEENTYKHLNYFLRHGITTREGCRW